MYTVTQKTLYHYTFLPIVRSCINLFFKKFHMLLCHIKKESLLRDFKKSRIYKLFKKKLVYMGIFIESLLPMYR